VQIAVSGTNSPVETRFERRVQLDGSMEVSASASSRITFAGRITGPGGLVSRSSDPFELLLAGDNDFSGGIEWGSSSGMTVLVGSDTALGSGTVTTNDYATIGALGGPRTVQNPVMAKGNFTIGGSDPFTFAGPINLFGGTRTITVDNTATTSFTGPVYGGNLTKAGNGTLQMTTVRMPKLTVSSGTLRVIPDCSSAATSKVQTLSVASGAAVDLTNNDLIIDYTGSSPASSIQSMIVDSRLRSSMQDSHHTLGYADNTAASLSSFGGLPVDSTSVLVGFTFFGDSDLNKQVDLADLTALAQHWQLPSVWTDGDFNYDGTVDIADLWLLAPNWQAGVTNPQDPPWETALATLGLPYVPIPEPGAIGIASGIICVTSLITRRRRRHINMPNAD
jgi:hypothetical protein